MPAVCGCLRATQAISAFLDSPEANPNTLEAALSGLSTTVPSVKSSLAAVKADMTDLSTTLGPFITGLTSLHSAVTLATEFYGRLTTLRTELQAVPASM